jgi:hypothetical protein
MTSSVRFTRDEREFIQQLVTAHATSAREAKLRDRIVDKLEKAALNLKKRKPEPGLGWFEAQRTMRGYLGNRLAVPPHPSEMWQMRMSSRIRDLGLTREDCVRLCQFAEGTGWRPPFSFETLIRGADRYLAAPPTPAPTGPIAGPLEVDREG